GSLQVGGDVIMRDADCSHKVDMSFARISRGLELCGAAVGEVDLSGASIGTILQLGGMRESAAWKQRNGNAGGLNLRHAHAAFLMDAREGAWPAKGRLSLEGFTFDHLGEYEENRAAKASWQQIKEWDNWARLDPNHSPGTYAQLATAFTTAGDRDGANEIRYLGREREREAACKESWLRSSCVLQTALGSVAGYGIGNYTFKVVPWVLFFWLAGASLLWWTVPAARKRGPIWCLCAGLAQLLPVIPINKELTDFFN